MSHSDLSRRDAARILDAPGDSDHPVGQAIQALRSPGSAAELRREDATVASFHAARLSPASRPMGGLPAVRRSAAARAVAATGLVVALTSGGFALAAGGHLPGLPDQASYRATDAVSQRARQSPTASASPVPASAARGASGRGPARSGSTRSASVPEPAGTAQTATEATTGATSDATVDASEETTAAPTPNLAGLCTAYQASDKSAHGKALDSPAFAALAAAAGGKDAIASYCVTLVGEPATKPTQAATGKPTAKPTQAATGKPTAKPTQAGTGKPTPKPTTEPSDDPTAETSSPVTTPEQTTPEAGQPSTPGSPAGKGAGKGKPEDRGPH